MLCFKESIFKIRKGEILICFFDFNLRKRDSTTAIILPRAPRDRVGHLLTTGLTCPTEAPNLYTAAVGLKD